MAIYIYRRRQGSSNTRLCIRLDEDHLVRRKRGPSKHIIDEDRLTHRIQRPSNTY